MKSTNARPFTVGMEIEQFTEEIPSAARNYVMSNEDGNLRDWEDDLSGPRETSIGGYKRAKTILNKWLGETRDNGITWDWHAADSTGRGAGSHVHLSVADDVFEDTVEAWTIAYNTVLEVWPFFAPYFCHNWEDGFRNGEGYRGSRSQIQRWASPTLTRKARSTMEDRVSAPTFGHDNSEAVTMNGARRNGKPMTIELRANDAHPAMALPALLQLRRITGLCIERGWSIKLEDHHDTLRKCYEKIYERAPEVGLLTAMQEPIEGGITFLEGRGLPEIERRSFDTMYEVLQALDNAHTRSAGTYRDRAQKLVAAGCDEFGPHNNPNALWHTDVDRGAFAWDHGPDMMGYEDPDADVTAREIRDVEPGDDHTTTATDVAGFGATRAAGLAADGGRNE